MCLVWALIYHTPLWSFIEISLFIINFYKTDHHFIIYQRYNIHYPVVAYLYIPHTIIHTHMISSDDSRFTIKIITILRIKNIQRIIHHLFTRLRLHVDRCVFIVNCCEKAEYSCIRKTWSMHGARLYCSLIKSFNLYHAKKGWVHISV